MDDVIVRAVGLCKYFGKGKVAHRAVDGVSFEIRRGEAFGLVGESGCGKTTLGRMLASIYEPTAGEVYFDGVRISAGTDGYRAAISSARRTYDERLSAAKSDSERRALKLDYRRTISENRAAIVDAARDVRKNRDVARRIQMIFQDPTASLDGRMTVREIISEGLVIKGERDRSLINARVMETLSRVGLLPEHAGRYPHEFSGGQRQRIGIARAIITEPELIIADEPISALDVSIRAQVINLLGELRRELGLTVLFIAHDLSVVKYFSDRIAVMYLGRIVELAESDELFKNPIHPYTRALLSAIPLPDPIYERGRKRLIYEPSASDEPEQLYEVSDGHFAAFTAERYAVWREEMGG